jgi:integrase
MKGCVTKKTRNGITKWYVVIDEPRGPDNKRKQAWHGPYDTADDAEEARARLKIAVADDKYVARKHDTVEAFLTDWLAALKLDVRDDNIRPGTYRRTESIVATHLIPHLGHFRVQKLRESHLTDMHNAISARVTVGTRRNIHGVLCKALDLALERRLVNRNVARDMRKPSYRPPVVRVWGSEQVAHFLSRTADTRDGALWHAYATTGCRRGELLGLRWSDVDPDTGRVTIEQAVIEVGGAVTYGKTKTGRTRTITLDGGTIAALREHKARQARERLAAGPGWADADLVFARPDGMPMRPSQVTRRFRGAAASAGLPAMSLHGLRHSWATFAIEQGVNAKLVAERLGHADVATTLRTYAHVSTSADAKPRSWSRASCLTGPSNERG